MYRSVCYMIRWARNWALPLVKISSLASGLRFCRQAVVRRDELPFSASFHPDVR